MTVDAPAAQVPRDNWGRPLVTPPKGGKPVAYRRCTTFIDVLEDRFALEQWKCRNVAIGMSQRPDLVLQAAAADGDKKTLNVVAKAASEAAGSKVPATTGSAVHALTEQVDRGQSPVIPPSAAPDVDAYRQATTGLKVEDLEVFVVDDNLKVGGTFDRVVSINGRRYVADIKTGRVDYGTGKILMQLAIYAGSRRYDPATGERQDLTVDQDWGLVIHLPAGAGECTIWWASLSDGRAGAQLAAQVWQWRGRSHKFTRELASLDVDIASAGSVDALTQLWRDHQGQWTTRHTAAAAARKQELLTQGA